MPKKVILKKDGTPRKKRNYSAARIRARVDKQEQERIRSSLASKYIPQMPREVGGQVRDHYTPEIGTELCIMRRAGMSARQIQKECGINYSTIKSWLSDYPEFSQEWKENYSAYMTDVAEEIVPRAEALLEGQKLDGKKLSVKQEARYLRALEHLSQEVHWAASRRVPELYGDKDGGNQLVIVQTTDIPRSVTQDPMSAIAHKKEIEDATTSMQGSIPADGGIGDDARLLDSGGVGGGEVQGNDKRSHPVRRYKRGGRPLVKP